MPRSTAERQTVAIRAVKPASTQDSPLTMVMSAAEEIAAAVETTVGNVRVLRHRALADLRACLEGAPA